jgi:hypothetical protein
MTELSPAAIAVDDALAACIQLQGEIVRARPLAAAALRAAADQVVPEEPAPKGMRPAGEVYSAREIKRQQRQDIRAQLLAIAAELRGITITTWNHAQEN